MKPQLRSLALVLSTVFAGAGCDRNTQPDATMMQAKFDAEKVKELTTQLEAAKASNTELMKENEDLKAQVAAAKAVAATIKQQPPVARNTAPARSTEKHDSKNEAAKESVTGGGSFK